MDITVTLKVKVDRQAWTANYGLETDAEIRADVKRYAASAVREQIATACDSEVEVTVR